MDGNEFSCDGYQIQLGAAFLANRTFRRVYGQRIVNFAIRRIPLRNRAYEVGYLNAAEEMELYTDHPGARRPRS
jgi:hypothetical protein